jgi:NAD(P)-dependent dehydrogenase (short-subunit alcohol dehydrogenase family)
VLTGATGGLGTFLVSELRADGDVVATYRKARGPLDTGVTWAKVDLQDSHDVSRFVEEHGTRLKRIVLLNLAGVSRDGMAHKLSEADYDEVLGTNLKGTFLMCRALLPQMRAEGWGRVIAASSVVAHLGIPGTLAYSASKAALHAMMRTVAVENAGKGVTANAVALGYFDAGMMYSLTPENQEKIKATIPMRRLGRPSEFLAAIRFIVGCEYLTGTTIDLNGGLR